MVTRYENYLLKIDELKKLQNELGGGTAYHPIKIFGAIKSGGERFSREFKSMFRIDENVNWKNLKGVRDFMGACKILLENFERFTQYEWFGQKVWKKVDFQSTRLLFENREVIVSFYGDCNSGKSTILNSILGDQFLPTEANTETGLSVQVEFLTPTSMDDHVDDAVLWYFKKEQVKGKDAIHEKLQTMNKATRENTSDIVSDCILKMKHPFRNCVKEDINFYLLDNPGYDEHGCEKISRIVDESRARSAAFIVITTFARYNTTAFSNRLQKLFHDCPGILSENRLTIVINKIDLVLAVKPHQNVWTTDEIKSKVANFICETLKIASFSPDCIVLVCGEWAFHARQCGKYPDQFQDSVEGSIHSLKSMKSLVAAEEYKAMINEDPLEQKIKKLENYSNLKQLELRIEMMAKSSLSIWTKKMTQELTQHISKLQEMLDDEKSMLEKFYTDLAEKVENIYKVICALHEVYSFIIMKEDPGQSLFQCFLKAFEEDNKVTNIKENLIEVMERELRNFKERTEEKIGNRNYQIKDLKKDLQSCIGELSTKINDEMLSYMTNLKQKYNEKDTEIYASLQDLRDKVCTLRGQYNSKSPIKECGATFVLVEENSSIPLNIPLELSLLQRLNKFFRSLFGLSIPSEYEPHQVEVIFGMMDEDDASVTKTSIHEEQMENSIYKRWSPEMDDMMMKVKVKSVEIIEKYFEDPMETIIKKCHEQHFTTAKTKLQQFNTAHLGQIKDCRKELKEKIGKLQEKSRQIEKLKKLMQDIKATRIDFLQIQV